MARLLLLCRTISTAVIAFLTIFVAQPTVRADIRLDVTTGFDNNLRAGSWTPLQIRLSGISADTAARIQVMVRTQSGTQGYSRGVRLRAGAVNGPYTVYYFHPEMALGKDITVQVSAEGRTLVEKTLDQVGNALQIPEGQPAVIGLTQDQSGLNFLSQVNLGYFHATRRNDQGQIYGNGFSSGPGSAGRISFNRVIYPKAANLPDNAGGYNAIDAAVLGDLPLDLLNEDQWAALVGWVKSGGILVVSGSADLNRLRTKQLSDILPVAPSGVKQVSSLPGLGYRYEASPKLRSSSVVVSQVKPDSLALCRQENLPLVVERRTGNGLVVFTAFDLLAPEFRAWTGQAGMWREIMQRGGGNVQVAEGIRLATEPSYTANRWGYNPNTNRALTEALAGVQSSEAPSFRTIGLFLLVYILVLVPGNYLLLKRFDKKELAWVTIPAIIFLFSAGAYAVGYKIKGGQLYLHYCTVLEGSANGDGWQAYSVASIFSPRQARYDLSIADPSALVMEVTEGGGPSQRGMGDLLVESDQKTVVKNALVNMWDHRQFDFQTFMTLGGQVSASVLPVNGGSAQVQVSNGTRLPLNDCSISYGTTQAMVGALAPGESRTVKISLQNNGSPGTVTIIGAGPTAGKAERNIREALASLASSAGAMTSATNQINSAGQPVTRELKTPFVLTGWFAEPVVGLALEKETPAVSGANLLVVHLPDPEGTSKAAPPPAAPPPARQDPFSGSGFSRPPQLGMGGAVAPPPAVFSGSGIQAAMTHNQNAYNFASSGDLNKALAEAKLALKGAPNNGMILDTVGEMYQRRKEYAKAVPYYAKALKQLPAGQRTETEQKFGETLIQLGKKTEGIAHLRIAAQDYRDFHGATARQMLAQMGANQTMPQLPEATGPIVRLNMGSAPPPIPSTGRGARRYLQPVQGGGRYYIIQRWDFTAGSTSSSTKTTYIGPGQPEPK